MSEKEELITNEEFDEDNCIDCECQECEQHPDCDDGCSNCKTVEQETMQDCKGFVNSSWLD
jgi:hypothetical protein